MDVFLMVVLSTLSVNIQLGKDVVLHASKTQSVKCQLCYGL